MIVDLFAGPDGWGEGARALGIADIVGIEKDADACATNRAAGGLVVQADVETYPLERFHGRTTGLIASPPCPDFSSAGKGAGIDGPPR